MIDYRKQCKKERKDYKSQDTWGKDMVLIEWLENRLQKVEKQRMVDEKKIEELRRQNKGLRELLDREMEKNKNKVIQVNAETA